MVERFKVIKEMKDDIRKKRNLRGVWIKLGKENELRKKNNGIKEGMKLIFYFVWYIYKNDKYIFLIK